MFLDEGEDVFCRAAWDLLVEHLRGEPITREAVRLRLFRGITEHIFDGRCDCEGDDLAKLEHMRQEMRALAKRFKFDGAIFDELATEIAAYWARVRAERAEQSRAEAEATLKHADELEAFGRRRRVQRLGLQVIEGPAFGVGRGGRGD